MSLGKTVLVDCGALPEQEARAETVMRTPSSNVTVAILAQGTSWAVAVTQAFFNTGSILATRNRRPSRHFIIPLFRHAPIP